MAAIFETWVTGRMARHRAEEAERNAPVVVALDALMVVRGAMAQMTTNERAEVVREMTTLIDDETDRAWRQFGAALATVEG